MGSLRSLAISDGTEILEDSVEGAGWPIEVTDPDGTTADLTGFSQDIGQVIDPETDQVVSGRLASVVLPIASLTAAGLGIPEGIADATSKPWVMVFDDSEGVEHTFKVSESHPDRTIGQVLCFLEVYVPA